VIGEQRRGGFIPGARRSPAQARAWAFRAGARPPIGKCLPPRRTDQPSRYAFGSTGQQNSLELHPDLIPNGFGRLIIHDDVLRDRAAHRSEGIKKLVEQLGGVGRRHLLHHRADVFPRGSAKRLERHPDVARADPPTESHLGGLIVRIQGVG